MGLWIFPSTVYFLEKTWNGISFFPAENIRLKIGWTFGLYRNLKGQLLGWLRRSSEKVMRNKRNGKSLLVKRRFFWRQFQGKRRKHLMRRLERWRQDFFLQRTVKILLGKKATSIYIRWRCCLLYWEETLFTISWFFSPPFLSPTAGYKKGLHDEMDRATFMD